MTVRKPNEPAAVGQFRPPLSGLVGDEKRKAKPWSTRQQRRSEDTDVGVGRGDAGRRGVLPPLYFIRHQNAF